MFRKHFVRTSFILLTVILLVTLVSYFHGGWSGINHQINTTTTNISLLPYALREELAVIEVSSSNYFVYFHGNAAFPDGTVLLSQLYEDEKPLPWWPKNQLIKVESGQWNIRVPLGVNGSPHGLLSGPGYSFIIYRPLIKAALSFDLVGPPPAQ